MTRRLTGENSEFPKKKPKKDALNSKSKITLQKIILQYGYIQAQNFIVFGYLRNCRQSLSIINQIISTYYIQVWICTCYNRYM